MKAVSIILPIVTSLTLIGATPTKRATGLFEYSYKASNGAPQVGQLEDPPSQECIKIREAAEEPADSPINDTDKTVILYLDDKCDGDTYYGLGPGKKLSERLKVRSVDFV